MQQSTGTESTSSLVLLLVAPRRKETRGRDGWRLWCSRVNLWLEAIWRQALQTARQRRMDWEGRRRRMRRTTSSGMYGEADAKVTCCLFLRPLVLSTATAAGLVVLLLRN